MNEHLLQYLWNHKIFTNTDFKDSEGNAVEIIDFGQWNHDAGPDFLNAKIRTRDLVFAGNIEIHIRSSDWILHGHSEDPAYRNVILHAVYEHNTDEFLSEQNIPTLELKHYIHPETVQKFSAILEQHSFVPCEKLFTKDAVSLHFSEENILKKLDEKSSLLEYQLRKYRNDYEAVLFHQIAYAFGLKVNAEIFRSIAESTDFRILRKISSNRQQLEAFFFGKAGWLDSPCDKTTTAWKREFDFITHKFQLNPVVFPPKFLRLRPPNFPTLRLSQLAHLYSREKMLFSKIIQAKNNAELKSLFQDISASEYWDNHYTFGKKTAKTSVKKLSAHFINLILLNAVLPVKYAYHRFTDEDTASQMLDIYTEIPAEDNHIIRQWKNLGAEIENALQSQSFIYHYSHSCFTKKCLNCSIGFQLLKHHDRTDIY